MRGREASLQLTGLGDQDAASGGTVWGTQRLDLLDHVEAVGDLTEHNVLAVQPWAWHGGDEELGAVGVWASVGHRQQTWLGVLLGEVLVWELTAVDGLAADTSTVGEVTTLQHEVWDHSVEWAAGVAEALLAGTESSEVLGGLWHNVVVQREHNAAQWLAVNLDVEIHLRHGNCSDD